AAGCTRCLLSGEPGLDLCGTAGRLFGARELRRLRLRRLPGRLLPRGGGLLGRAALRLRPTEGSLLRLPHGGLGGSGLLGLRALLVLNRLDLALYRVALPLQRRHLLQRLLAPLLVRRVELDV